MKHRHIGLFVGTVARIVLWSATVIGGIVKTGRMVAKGYHRLYGLMKTITDNQEIHD